MSLTRWKVLGSRYVVRDPWMTLRADHCETAHGVTLNPYYVQEPPDWVQIVALDRDGRILVIRQYRHGAGVIAAEIPAGMIEPGETPEQAARRELLEEAGCVSDALLPLPVFSPNPARYSNRIHAFVATNTRIVQEQSLDESEEIECGFLAVPEVFGLIDGGEFCQAPHIAALCLALRKLGVRIAEGKGGLETRASALSAGGSS